MTPRTSLVRRPGLRFILVIAALDTLALGLSAPVMPALLRGVVGGGPGRVSTWVGVFVVLWAAMQFLLSPAVGALSDRFGRRPVLLGACAGSCAGFALMAWAASLPGLILARIVSGAASANLSASHAYVADVSSPDERAACFSLVAATCGAGFLAGPVLGGVLGDIDVRLPFWVAAGLSLANAIFGVIFMAESLPRERRALFAWRSINPVGSLGLLSSRPALAAMAGAQFLLMVSEMAMPSTFVLYVTERFGWTNAAVGLIMTVATAANLLVQAVLFKPTVVRLGERRALVAGLLAGGLGLAMCGWAPTTLWLWLGVIPMAWYGLAAPLLRGLLTRQADPARQGQMQGAIACLFGVAGVLGPLLFTQVFGHFGRAIPGNPSSGAPFILAALMLMLAVPLAWRGSSRSS